MTNSRRRGVIREHEFDEQLFALIPNWDEMDEFVAAAEELLSEDPYVGAPLGKDEIWMLPMAPTGSADVWLYYRFDDRNVVFLAILSFP